MKDKNKATVNKTKAEPRVYYKGRDCVENVGAENAIRLFINQKPAAANRLGRIEDPYQKVNTFIKLMELVIPKRDQLISNLGSPENS